VPSLMELLGDIGYAVDTPGAYARGLLAARPGERVSGRELFGLEEGTGNEILGLLAEMGLDPLNLLTVGGAGAAKAALPLLAMSKLDKAGDLGRAGMKLEDVLAHNKMVDELLEAGVMPQELAEKTLFSKSRHKPRAGVTPEEIVKAYTEFVPDARDYGLTDEQIVKLVEEQLSEPVHAVSSGAVGRDLAGGGLADLGELELPPARRSLQDDLDNLVESLSGGDPEDYGRSLQEARAAGGSGVTPIRLSPESETLADLFEEVRELSPAQHATSAADLDRFSDVLTSGGNIPVDLDVVGGGPWGGSGVYVAPEGKDAAYLLGRKKLQGMVAMENPLIIPGGRHYGPQGLQDFIRQNPELFPNLTDAQKALIGTATEGKISETSIGLADEAAELLKLDSLAAAEEEALLHAEEVWDTLSESKRGMAEDFMANEGLEIDHLVGKYQQHIGEGFMDGQDAESFESFLAKTMDEADHATEGFSFDEALDNPFGEVAEEMELQAKASELGATDEMLHGQPVSLFTPERASEIARGQGYDAVVYSEQGLEGKNWMDKLYEAGEYSQFREAVLEDPHFWLEVNLLYPETAERYLSSEGAGFLGARTGDPGHGQMFNIGPGGQPTAGKKIAVPKGSVPPENVQKALLAAIGFAGMNEVLKSMEKNREVAV